MLPTDRITFLQITDNKPAKYFNKLYAKNILHEVRKICKKTQIDIIHLLTTDYTCSLIMPQLKKISAVYFTVHDFLPHESAHANKKGNLILHYITWGVRRNMKTADYLVTNSKNQLSMIKEAYPLKNIFYYPFPSLVTESVLNGDKKCPESADVGKYILFFGNIQKYKGVEYLHSAFANNKNLCEYKLVIAGNGFIYFPHDNDPRIIFINRYIKDDEIKLLFEKASCVVYPYISATQSGVLTLAFRFQTPALVSDIPFFRENSDNECCLFFEPANATDLSKKLETMLFDTDLAKMKNAQKEFYDRNYSQEASVAYIESIYQQEN
jgi:glycosyltransferase involved in cell wall biosynthesis